MILTTHILSGTVLGENIKNPYIIAVSSLVVHFLLDMFPHGDYLNKKSRWREFWKVAVDLAVGFGLVFAITFLKDITDTTVLKNIFIGIFFSLLPDGTTFLYIWMKMKFLRPVKDFHENLHLFKNGAPQREFRFKNNLWDIFISLILILLLIK